MFKLPSNETEGSAKLLETLNNELKLMERLWEHIKLSQGKFSEYLKIKFSQFDVGEKEDEVKKLRNGLQAIKVTDRKSNVFLGITD